MSDQQAALRTVRQHLDAVRAAALKAAKQPGENIRALGTALVSADDALGKDDTLAAAKAALTALHGGHDAALVLGDRKGSPWRDDAAALLRAETDLRGIVAGWPVPPAPPPAPPPPPPPVPPAPPPPPVPPPPPPPAPPAPPPPPVPPPATARASGYNTGNGDTAIDDAGRVAAWRGAPISAYSVFNWGHVGQASFVDSYTKPGWTPFRTIPILARDGIMPVCTIPGAVGDQHDMGAIAAGALDDMHRGCARWLAAQPWRTDVALRLSRECNDPDQPFYYGATSAARATWRKAHARIFGIYAAELGPRALFVFCVMKRTLETDWTQAIPLDDLPRGRLVLSVDAYLNKPYDDTPAGYQDHTWSFVAPKVDYAARNGLKVAFSEWAVTDVDQPGNTLRHLQMMDGLARSGALHHDHYFGSTESHALFGSTRFPRSAAAYVDWWRSS